MQQFVTISVGSPLTARLGNCFGDGAPGWLMRDVPGDTQFDLDTGKVTSPGGIFIRSSVSGLWARAH